MVKKMSLQDIIQLAVCSDLIRNILISLNGYEKSLSDLREGLKISSTTALHALKELENNNLTFQNKRKNYALTNIGKIITMKLLDFSNTAEALKRQERFWFSHNLAGIPESLLMKIGYLKNSDVVEMDTLDMFKTHSVFVNFIKSAKWIKGVSPIFSTDYPEIFREMMENDVSVQIIVTKPVLKKTIDALGQETFDKLLLKSNFCLSIINENLKVAFTVTDSFFSLGLFTDDGIYDPTHDLMSTDEKAIDWGSHLFEYYLKRAKEFEK